MQEGGLDIFVAIFLKAYVGNGYDEVVAPSDIPLRGGDMPLQLDDCGRVANPVGL